MLDALVLPHAAVVTEEPPAWPAGRAAIFATLGPHAQRLASAGDDRLAGRKGGGPGPAGRRARQPAVGGGHVARRGPGTSAAWPRTRLEAYAHTSARAALCGACATARPAEFGARARAARKGSRAAAAGARAS